METNIFEILRDKSKGTKLYSPLFGECLLDHTVKSSGEIWVKMKESLHTFDKYGRAYGNGEPLLFPSKDMHDWDKVKQHQFKPFDKVLVRDSDIAFWRANIFSRYVSTNFNPYVCITGCYRQCIPYEGNEHLLGTDRNP